tara:strand:+ start:225 stop:2012 length:1788 start_codon:yes stop_codon:yes gene_type:complete
MARISEQSIEQVRNAADVVDVISDYVDLKQKGRNFFGLCPFHSEKTPSFSVNPEKQIYKCFGGCGAGGGVINFIMSKENLEYPDAIKLLAQKYNIKLEITGGDNKKFKDLKSQLVEIHDIATNYYIDLLHNTKEGQDALKYLTDRGLSLDTIKKFKIGFSLDSFDGLLKLLQKKSFSSESMKSSGLFVDGKKGYYDRFRSRIMFPVSNQLGDVIAFGGRIFNSDNPAKYVNSEQTPIYDKSKTLYGLNINLDNIKEQKRIILVEGYMDVIQLYQSGINCCVAISGTAFNNQGASQVKRFSKEAYVMLDGDTAGVKSAIRCGYILTANGVKPNIITPPDNLDPDDWVKRDGSDKVLSELSNSMDVISAHYAQFTLENSDDYLNINNFIEVCVDEIARMDNSIMRELLAKRLSEITKVSTDAILEPLNLKIDKRKSYRRNVKSDKSTQSEVKNNKFSQKLYDDLIMLCCCKNQDVRKFIFDNLNVEWMQSDTYRAIYDSIYIHLVSDFEPQVDIICEKIDDNKIRDKFIKLTFDLNNFIPSENIAKDCLRRIEIEYVNANIENLRLDIKNNPEDISLIKVLSDFEKEISNIKAKYNE